MLMICLKHVAILRAYEEKKGAQLSFIDFVS